MKYNVNPADYYPHLKDNPYPEFYPDSLNDFPLPKEEDMDEPIPFRQGDVVYDESNDTVAIVLGTIDLKGGELRLDTDGMQPIENLRPATLEDFENSQYSTTENHQKLFLECCKQANVAPVRMQVEAKIKKNMMVYVTVEDGMDEDAIIEAGREMAHEMFNPNNDERTESYSEDSKFLGSGESGILFD
jgi:hypothetical protein